MGAAFLDREAALAELRDAAATLAEQRRDVVEVWLFGSLARGDHARRSDADLLVVLESSDQAPRDRIPDLLDPFIRLSIPVDLVPMTRDEVASREARRDRFIQRVREEGVRLYPTAPA